MKPHSWEVEEVDGGPVGVNDCWICHQCGASGGPVWYNEKGQQPGPSMNPFLAGPGIRLSEDCDEAKQQIQDFINSDVH